MDGLWKSCEGLAARADELQLPSEPRRQMPPNAQCHRTGTVMPIHRHKDSSETCVCVRGHFEEYFYNQDGNLTDTSIWCQVEWFSTSKLANGIA